MTPVSPVSEEFASIFDCPVSPLDGYSVDEFNSIARSVFQPAVTRAIQQGFSSSRLLTEPQALEFEALMDMDYGCRRQAQCWEEYSKMLALAVFGDFCRIRACSCVVNMPFLERTLQYAVSETVMHPRRGDARHVPANHTPLYQDGRTLVGMVRLASRELESLPDRRNEIVCVSSESSISLKSKHKRRRGGDGDRNHNKKPKAPENKKGGDGDRNHNKKRHGGRRRNHKEAFAGGIRRRESYYCGDIYSGHSNVWGSHSLLSISLGDPGW